MGAEQNEEAAMRSGIIRTLVSIAFLAAAELSYGQAQGGGSGTNYLVYSIAIIAVLLFFYMIVQVADNLLAIEAKQSGVTQAGVNLSVVPGLREFVAPRVPSYVGDGKVKALKRGHDIKLKGEAKKEIDESVSRTTFAVQPPNFIGLSPIPKVVVEVGESVKAGDPLFYDKQKPEIKFAAPVSGEVIAVNRGAKRSIAEVVILADKDIKYRVLEPVDPEKSSREELAAFLLESGVWPMIRQRPFDVIPEPGDIPRDIFISTFDTAPLAPDLNFVIQGREAAFQKGLDVLGKLTTGKVHLGLDARKPEAPAKAFTEALGVEKHWFHGKHPAGNVGIHIHHIDSIRPNDKVWTLGVQEVATLGALFTEKRFNAGRTVAVTGAEVTRPRYVKTYLGARIGDLVKDNLSGENVRLISGDVLSGSKTSEDQFLNFFDDQVTVILEGDYYEMFGWLLPISPRPSISWTFPNFLFPGQEFRADTNTHGEKRAFVMTGQYENVLPMDIYPQHLMKAILVKDFEKMEGLGLYELIEEDIALCEFACTSKQPLQQILREGLDMIREQS